MGFVIKRPSRLQGQWFFQSWAGRATVLGRVQKKSRQEQKFPGGLPLLEFDIVRKGGLNVHRG
jgi:hypothetical protein